MFLAQQRYDLLKEELDKIVHNLEYHVQHVSKAQVRSWRLYKNALNRQIKTLAVQLDLIKKQDALPTRKDFQRSNRRSYLRPHQKRIEARGTSDGLLFS
jgi:hypothetical protein